MEFNPDLDCAECQKPDDIDPWNTSAWTAWVYASRTGRDGTTGALRTADIKAAMEIAGCTADDFERILNIEKVYQEKKK